MMLTRLNFSDRSNFLLRLVSLPTLVFHSILSLVIGKSLETLSNFAFISRVFLRSVTCVTTYSLRLVESLFFM